MTTTSAPAAVSSNGSAHRKASGPPNLSSTHQAASRNRTRIVVGALILAVSALAAVVLYANLGNRHPVLTVIRRVAAGETITAGDLGQTQLPGDTRVSWMPVSQRAHVLGRVAAVDMVPGTLLVSSQLSDGAEIATGRAVIGASLKPGQFPPGLRQGDKVLAIAIPLDSTGATEASSQATFPIPATVVSVQDLADSGGNVVVSLAVPPDSATALAIAGAHAGLTLVLAAR